jgi:hypothetical protein
MSEVNFTHIRRYGDDGSTLVNGGETLAHAIDGTDFVIARARVNEEDRYVKEHGRKISLARLTEALSTSENKPGHYIRVPLSEIAKGIAEEYANSPAQALISGTMKDSVRNLVYAEIMKDHCNAREHVMVGYAVSTHGNILLRGLRNAEFFPVGRRIGMYAN